jgi:hypothetical protein
VGARRGRRRVVLVENGVGRYVMERCGINLCLRVAKSTFLYFIFGGVSVHADCLSREALGNTG